MEHDNDLINSNTSYDNYGVLKSNNDWEQYSPTGSDVGDDFRKWEYSKQTLSSVIYGTWQTWFTITHYMRDTSIVNRSIIIGNFTAWADRADGLYWAVRLRIYLNYTDIEVKIYEGIIIEYAATGPGSLNITEDNAINTSKELHNIYFIFDYCQSTLNPLPILTAQMILTNDTIFGWSPVVTDVSIDKEIIETYEEFTITAISINATSFITRFDYLETSRYTEVDMEENWYFENSFKLTYSFEYLGVFSYACIGYNGFNTTVSEINYISVQEIAFPERAYLNIRSYEYRDVPETLFYVYLGLDEQEKLFDFSNSNLRGSWTGIGSVNASYTTNALQFTTASGGVKSDFDHITPGILYALDNATLIVQMKAIDYGRLVIIVDPTGYDADYLLIINESYFNYIITVQIPFYMFQNFDSYNGFMGEIGFWASQGTFSLYNIKLANFHDSTFLINYSEQNITTENISIIPTEFITNIYNFSGTSAQSGIPQWENSTHYVNDTFIDSNSTILTTHNFTQTISSETFEAFDYGYIPSECVTNYALIEQNKVTHTDYENVNINYSPTGSIENIENNNNLYYRIQYYNDSNFETGLKLNFTVSSIHDDLYLDYRIWDNLAINPMPGYLEYRTGKIKIYNYSSATFETIVDFISFPEKVDNWTYINNTNGNYGDETHKVQIFIVQPMYNDTGYPGYFATDTRNYFIVLSVDPVFLFNFTHNSYDFIVTDIENSLYETSFNLLDFFNITHIQFMYNISAEISTNFTASIEYYGLQNETQYFYYDLEQSSLHLYKNLTTSKNSGHYKGYYNWSKQDIGDEPEFWTTTGTTGDCDVRIVNELAEHNKIVELYDGTDAGKCAKIQNNTIPDITTGTIQFWIRLTDTTKISTWLIRDVSQSAAIYGLIGYGYIGFVSNSQPGGYLITEFTPDTWHYISVDFDVSSGWNISIDNVKYGEYDYFGVPLAIDSMQIYTATASTSYSLYLDSIDFSWTSGYIENQSQETYFPEGVVTISWQTSIDNTTWSSEYYDSIINDYHERYLKIVIEFNITNTIEENLHCNYTFNYERQNITAYYLLFNSSSDFTTIPGMIYYNHSFTLIFNTDYNFINSSLFTYNYTAGTWTINLSKIENLTCYPTFDLNTTQYINISMLIYSYYPFTIQFLQFYTNLTYYNSIKYGSIEYNISLIEYEELSLWYRFNESRANLLIYVENDTGWYLFDIYEKSVLNQSVYGSIESRYNQIWENITLFHESNFTSIRLNFTLYNPTNWTEIKSIDIKRFEIINLVEYRLESIANRQDYHFITFDYNQETLLIVDFAGRDIYREKVNYSEYIDIYLNIAEITLINNSNKTIFFIFQLSITSEIWYGVGPYSQRNIMMLEGDYLIKISDNETILNMRAVSITSTNKSSIYYEENVTISDDNPWYYTGNRLLDLLLDFFVYIFGDGFWPWGFIFILIIIIAVVYEIIRYYSKKQKKKIEKERKKVARLEKEIKTIRGY